MAPDEWVLSHRARRIPLILRLSKDEPTVRLKEAVFGQKGPDLKVRPYIQLPYVKRRLQFLSLRAIAAARRGNLGWGLAPSPAKTPRRANATSSQPGRAAIVTSWSILSLSKDACVSWFDKAHHASRGVPP